MRDGRLRLGCAVLVVALLVGSGLAGCQAKKGELVLTNQTWTESLILGSLFRQLIEAQTNITVKVVELDSFMIQWEAFKAGEVDIAPQYTASGYMTVLGDTGLRDSDKVYEYVKQEFEMRFNVTWLSRLGFYNNYDLAVVPEVAERYNLKTYSDLAKVSKDLVIAADTNFLDRPDCYPLLEETYGMEFKDIKTLAVELKYSAVANAQAQIVNCYTTDAKLREMGLVVLKDDKNAFPPYDVAPMIRDAALRKYPELTRVFKLLEGKISNDAMREMNYRVDILNEEPAKVAKDFLEKEGLLKKIGTG